MHESHYCPECGGALERHQVGGELRNHWYCSRCRQPHYDHPMVVVTCFVACGKRLLWVQRDLEPKRGLWAIPGGYLERGETLAQGAAREVLTPANLSEVYSIDARYGPDDEFFVIPWRRIGG